MIGVKSAAIEPARKRRRSALVDSVQGVRQESDRSVDVVQLVQAEQADAKRPVVVAFVAHQRHAGRDLQAVVEELPAILQIGVVGVADHHTRRLKALGGDAAEAAALQQIPNAPAQFDLFLADHPSSDLAGHSQYWLGETYYVTQQFEQALPEFQKVLDGYPDSRKLPDAMLKVGYCHYELGQYPQARAELNRVLEQYPESTAARLAGQRLDRMKSEGR